MPSTVWRTDEQYLKAAAAYGARSTGADVYLAWQAEIARSWSDVRFGADFTPRILPHHALALGPEIGPIVWHK